MRVLRWVCCWLLLLGAAPSRTQTYTAGEIISSSEVTENEDNIFSYLQAGVDTYKDASIATAKIQDAAVTAAKLATGAATSTVILDSTITPSDISGSPADDTAYIADSASAGTWRSLPNCTDASGNHLNYTQSSNSFSCGTTSSTATVVADTVIRTAGNVTTTSTTLVDFTGASITLTTGANPVLIGWAAGGESSVAGESIIFDPDIDGTAFGAITFQPPNANARFNYSFTIMTADQTAASHTFKMRWRVGSGTGLVVCGSGAPCTFWVVEVTD